METKMDKVKKDLPKTCDEFEYFIKKMYEVFLLKQAMYGTENISIGGDISDSKDRKMALLGVWFRMNDKIQRIQNILKKEFDDEDIEFESLEDSYLDLANYAIISLLVKREIWGK
tara:strand:+ start:277 stop:621 length:345 start_codon:yes stop_codon:yes gene_type:complete